MKKNILATILLTSVSAAHISTAQASTINLSDNSFVSVEYETFVQGPLGPIVAFVEMVDGVTFNFETSGQFRKVGTWGNGTTQSSAPWALQFGGGGGNPSVFSMTTDTDVSLNSFSGFGQQFNTSPIFDVTGTGVSSMNNVFSTDAFLSTGTPVEESFLGGPLSLIAGETYTFLVTNGGAATNGYITSMDFTAPSQVPVPAAAWLFGSGLLGLIGLARRKQI